MQKKAIHPYLKRAYETPVLVVYGTIWKLTHQVGVTGAKDGGVPPNLRTQTHA